MLHHTAPISGVAASNGYVATAGYDNRLMLWRGRAAVACAWHDHLVNACSFSRDGQLLVSASSDYSARVWSVPQMRLLRCLNQHDDDVEAAMFSPASDRVATASRDGKVRIFDLARDRVAVLEGHGADVTSIGWAEDGEALVSTSDDGTLRRWCARSGRQLATVDLSGVETDSAVCHPSGLVYAGNDNGEIIVADRGGVTHRMPAHRAGIKRLIFDHTATHLVASSYDRSLSVWRRTRSGALELAARHDLPASVWGRSLAFVDDSHLVLGAFQSCYASLCLSDGVWDLGGGRDLLCLNAVLQTSRGAFAVGDAGIVYRDGLPLQRLGSLCNFLVQWGERIVSGGHLGCLYDAGTGQTLLQHTSPLNCAAVLSSGDLLVGTYTGECIVLSRNASDTRTLSLCSQAVKSMAAIGDDVMAVAADGSAAFYNVENGGIARFARAHERIANGVCALADGRFASVSRDRRVTLWSNRKKEVIETPHDHSIKCVASSKSGRWLATGSYDGKIAWYDVARGEWRKVIRPTSGGISCLTCCDDDDRLLASSYDGWVYQITPDNWTPLWRSQ